MGTHLSSVGYSFYVEECLLEVEVKGVPPCNLVLTSCLSLAYNVSINISKIETFKAKGMVFYEYYSESCVHSDPKDGISKW